MGTKFAPSYANLFMGSFETQHIIKSSWFKNIVVYKRYIDKLFFIWKGEKDEFDNFVHSLNNNLWGLTFSGTISSDKLEYLDLEIKILNNHIITSTFFKSIEFNSLLNYKSSHYRKWLQNIPYGQMRRLQKNCSRDCDFKNQSAIMKSRFKKKGYPGPIINYAIKKTLAMTQDSCL